MKKTEETAGAEEEDKVSVKPSSQTENAAADSAKADEFGILVPATGSPVDKSDASSIQETNKGKKAKQDIGVDFLYVLLLRCW